MRASLRAPLHAVFGPVHVRMRGASVCATPANCPGKQLHKLPPFVEAPHSYRRVFVAAEVPEVQQVFEVMEVEEEGVPGQYGYVAPVAPVAAVAFAARVPAVYRYEIEEFKYVSALGHYFVAFCQWCRVCRNTLHLTRNCTATQPRQQMPPPPPGPPPPAWMPQPPAQPPAFMPPGLWPPLQAQALPLPAQAGQRRPRPAEWGDAREAP